MRILLLILWYGIERFWLRNIFLMWTISISKTSIRHSNLSFFFSGSPISHDQRYRIEPICSQWTCLSNDSLLMVIMNLQGHKILDMKACKWDMLSIWNGCNKIKQLSNAEQSIQLDGTHMKWKTKFYKTKLELNLTLKRTRIRHKMLLHGHQNRAEVVRIWWWVG